MVGFSLRWQLSLPEGRFQGLLGAVDPDSDVSVDDPRDVLTIVEAALRDPDGPAGFRDLEDGAAATVHTSRGEHLTVTILHRYSD